MPFLCPEGGIRRVRMGVPGLEEPRKGSARQGGKCLLFPERVPQQRRGSGSGWGTLQGDREGVASCAPWEGTVLPMCGNRGSFGIGDLGGQTACPVPVGEDPRFPAEARRGREGPLGPGRLSQGRPREAKRWVLCRFSRGVWAFWGNPPGREAAHCAGGTKGVQ